MPDTVPASQLPKRARSHQGGQELLGHARAPCDDPERSGSRPLGIAPVSSPYDAAALARLIEATVASAVAATAARQDAELASQRVELASQRVELDGLRAELAAMRANAAEVASQTRMERRVSEILRHALALGCVPLALATGTKSAIKSLCLENATLFSDSTFDASWKLARARGLVRMGDLARFVTWEKRPTVDPMNGASHCGPNREKS